MSSVYEHFLPGKLVCNINDEKHYNSGTLLHSFVFKWHVLDTTHVTHLINAGKQDWLFSGAQGELLVYWKPLKTHCLLHSTIDQVQMRSLVWDVHTYMKAFGGS